VLFRSLEAVLVVNLSYDVALRSMMNIMVTKTMSPSNDGLRIRESQAIIQTPPTAIQLRK